MVLVIIQLSVPGSYLLPVLKSWPACPPQTIISLPVQTAVCHDRLLGALVVLVAVQLSVVGLYLPPVFMYGHSAPYDHLTASPDCRMQYRAEGALVGLVAIQLFVMGLYLPPVFTNMLMPANPPQTIISVPVQTAV